MTGIINRMLRRKEMSKEEHDKKNDLKHLENIFEAIVKWNNKFNLQKCLIAIGTAAEKISFNERNDKDSCYIRNKYGYIRRNKGKAVNKDGIYFERLAVFKDSNLDQIFEIDEEKSKLIRKDLFHLKQKLLDIFRMENHRRDHIKDKTRPDFSASISYLKEFSSTCHEYTTLNTMNSLIEHLSSINFNLKDDRYYFARAFCIIGELLNELIEDKNKDSINKFVLKSFKNLINIRNSICHFHKPILNGTIDKNERINEIIVDIQNHLKKVIYENFDFKNRFAVDYEYKDAEMFQEDTQKLLTYIKRIKNQRNNQTKQEKIGPKAEKEKSIKIKINKDKKSIRDKLIDKISEEESLNKRTINKLRSVDVKYQLYRKTLNDDKIEYPPALSMEYKGRIFTSSKRIEVDLRTDIKHLKQPSNQIEIELSNKKDKVIAKLETILEEVKYLRLIVGTDVNTLSITTKTKYISEHIIMVIGQYIRDCEDIKVCNNKGEKQEILQRVSPYLDRFSKSLLLTEVKRTCKAWREKGLAHNIQSLDSLTFSERIKDILDMCSYFEAFLLVLKNKTQPDSFSTFCERGFAFFKIGLHDKAIEYLDKAVQCSEDQLNEDNVSSLDASFKDFIEILGFSSNICQINRCRRTCLYKTNQIEKACLELDLILNGINFTKLAECENIELKKEVNSLFSEMGKYFSKKGYLEEATNLLMYANRIYEVSETKFCLAKNFFNLNEFQKSKESCNSILQHDSNSVCIFNALKMLVKISLVDLKIGISEAKSYINQMKTVFKTSVRDFKLVFLDNYLFSKFIIIRYEINLFILTTLNYWNQNTDADTDLARLDKIQKEFWEISKKLEYNSESKSKITQINLLLSSAYCSIYLRKSISSSNSLTILNNAEDYFTLAVSNIEQFADRNHKFEIQIMETAFALSSSFNICVVRVEEHLSRELHIEYLMKALRLEEQYHLKKDRTFQFLGVEYYYIAEDCSNKSDDITPKDISDLKLVNYSEAIKYFESYLREVNIKDSEECRNIKMFLEDCFQKIAFINNDLKNSGYFSDQFYRCHIL